MARTDGLVCCPLHCTGRCCIELVTLWLLLTDGFHISECHIFSNRDVCYDVYMMQATHEQNIRLGCISIRNMPEGVGYERTTFLYGCFQMKHFLWRPF